MSSCAQFPVPYHFQPQFCITGTLRAEVTDRTLERVRRTLQRFGSTTFIGMTYPWLSIKTFQTDY